MTGIKLKFDEDLHDFKFFIKKTASIINSKLRILLSIFINDDVEQAKQLTENSNAEKPQLTISHIFEELKQIQQEFSGFKFSKEHKTISIITKPITLEDTYLGPFQIDLHINRISRLYKESPYFCIALEPNPAANNSEVTHPHVSSEKLAKVKVLLQ